MRFLHTSDWHLGRSFFGVSLLEDQAVVLDQLVALVGEAGVDAVLVAGDVYDRSAPPADAVRLLDETLTRIVVGAGVPVVMIAGNHDSGDRLGFASRLLGDQGLHVAGTEPLAVTLGDDHGPVEVLAVPFAEPAATAARLGRDDLADHDSALRADLAALLAAAGGSATATCAGKPPARTGSPPARRQGASSRRIAMAHAFVSGGSTSESERPLVLGNAALVAADCFEGFSYAALGHLHRPQGIGRREVRYSGSLLKYSFDEASHTKSVSVVEIDAKGACSIEEVTLTPRRDVRILEGTIEELGRAGANDTARDDYVLARLTDHGAVLDAMGKVRTVYPNCLHIQRDVFLQDRADDGTARVDLRRHSETELFEAFFREVTGKDADADEARAFADALAAVRRRGDEDA